jgi:hypothetical protein
LSPLLEIISDVIAQAIGGVVDRKQPRAPFPEGEGKCFPWCGSSPVGSLAFIFALGVLVNAAYPWDFTTKDYASLTGASLALAALAFGGRRAGARAPEVTRRNLGLARFGYGSATLGPDMSLVAALIAAIRLIQQIL